MPEYESALSRGGGVVVSVRAKALRRFQRGYAKLMADALETIGLSGTFKLILGGLIKGFPGGEGVRVTGRRGKISLNVAIQIPGKGNGSRRSGILTLPSEAIREAAFRQLGGRNSADSLQSGVDASNLMADMEAQRCECENGASNGGSEAVQLMQSLVEQPDFAERLVTRALPELNPEGVIVREKFRVVLLELYPVLADIDPRWVGKFMSQTLGVDPEGDTENALLVRVKKESGQLIGFAFGGKAKAVLVMAADVPSVVSPEPAAEQEASSAAPEASCGSEPTSAVDQINEKLEEAEAKRDQLSKSAEEDAERAAQLRLEADQCQARADDSLARASRLDDSIKTLRSMYEALEKLERDLQEA